VARRQTRRQRIRKLLLLVSLLLFPITIYCFSPYMIIYGAAQGIINGSSIVFALEFLSALFVGRVWCGWGCPAATISAGWHSS
jgi:ferredoxin-type protein NapH